MFEALELAGLGWPGNFCRLRGGAGCGRLPILHVRRGAVCGAAGCVVHVVDKVIRGRGTRGAQG